MRMTTEFIERLREKAKALREIEFNFDELATDLELAARVIENLSEKINASQTERSNQLYIGRWISVNERLPENDDDVLVWDGCNNMVAWCIDGKWSSLDECFKSSYPIKYWMSLPKEPYKSKEDE